MVVGADFCERPFCRFAEAVSGSTLCFVDGMFPDTHLIYLVVKTGYVRPSGKKQLAPQQRAHSLQLAKGFFNPRVIKICKVCTMFFTPKIHR